MCGRYPLSGNEEEVAELLAAGPTEELRTPYNIAPTQPMPVIRQVGSGRAIRRAWFRPMRSMNGGVRTPSLVRDEWCRRTDLYGRLIKVTRRQRSICFQSGIVRVAV